VQAAIDLDQQLIESFAIDSSETRQVYEKGGYSLSYAILTLQDPAPLNLPRGTIVTGKARNGHIISGTITMNVTTGDDTVTIMYNQVGQRGGNRTSRCHVGGLSEPITAGCKWCCDLCCRYKVNGLILVGEYSV